MKAVVYDRPEHFRVSEIPTPEPGPGEVRVRLQMTGVCGTDVHIHAGRFFSSYPLIPGHEPTGVVDALGQGVTGIEVGRRVAVNGNTGCGSCDSCRRGYPLLCANLRCLGVNGPGGFAEHMLAPAGNVFPVDDLPVEVAAMTEPTACAMHGMDVLGLRPGSDVLLFGAGPTGLILAQLLLHGGAARLTVAAPTAYKLELARSFGVDETALVDRHDAAAGAQRVRRLAPDGFDVVIDATGSSAVTQQALGLTRDRGTLLVYGVTGQDDRIAVSPYDIYRRELTIKGSFAQVSSFPSAIAMLRSGRVRTEGIITHRFPLDRFADALEAVQHDERCHKAVMVP
jgi:D-arabinitol dehydrogenase (NADP+)